MCSKSTTRESTETFSEIYLNISKIPGFHGLPWLLHGRGERLDCVHDSLAGAATALDSQASWSTIDTLPKKSDEPLYTSLL